MTEAVYVTSPVGRLVQGDPFEGSTTDHQGRPRISQSGQAKTQWFIAVAFLKDAAWEAMWGQITQIAQRDFPAGEWQQPGFAWKVIDGDAPEHAGKEGFAGHFILRMSTGFPPQVFNEANQQISAEHNLIKRGDYVMVYFSIRGNGEPASGKPGVYLNHSMIGLVRPGEAISVGPSAEQAFGAARPVVAPPAPAGGMPAPMAPAPAPMAPMAAPPTPAPGAPLAPAGTLPPAPAPVAPAGTPPPMAPLPAAGTPAAPTAYPSNGQPPAGVPEGTQPAPNFMVPGQPPQ